jgi:DNA-binding MarR family transcriptional regulator
LARLEQISPQSMGATLAGLEERGLVTRSADPADGRRVVMSVTDIGRQMVGRRRDARVEQIVAALDGFTKTELQQILTAAPLIQRLADGL